MKTFNCLNCNANINSNAGNLIRKFCSNICQGEYRSTQHYQYFLHNPDKCKSSKFKVSTIKPHILKEQNYKCSICSTGTTHNGKPLVLILDHIDGDATNNTRDNYRLVCPNCDSQLPTFKGRNKGKSTRMFNVKQI